MRFVFEQIRTGGDRNFGYLVGDREAKVCAIVDPSFDPESLIERANAQQLKVAYIINTHGHPDHINGNPKAIELTGAAACAFKDSQVISDIPLADEAFLKLGDYTLRFYHTPGHADDHMVIVVEKMNVAITGDLIFVGKVGGTSGEHAAQTEWDSLQRMLKILPDETTLWPGHDYGCRPSTTMFLEKQTNPFMMCSNLQQFLSLKANWSELKADAGLK